MRKLWMPLVAGVAVSIGRAGAQTPAAGPEFQVNTYTTGAQGAPSVAMRPDGDSVVTWISLAQVGSGPAIFARRFDEFGLPIGAEFQVNTYTAGTSGYTGPKVSIDPSGNFVVVWESASDGSNSGIAAQRFNAAGVAQGGEFQVNTYTTSDQIDPEVAVDSSGNFVVVWQSYGQDGSDRAVIGRRYDSSGTALGAEFQVNTTTTGAQYLPSVATDPSGAFVVVWSSVLSSTEVGVFGRRYDNSGNALGSEFRVDTTTANYQYPAKVGVDGAGNFIVAWPGTGDGSGSSILARRYDSSGTAAGSPFQVNTYTTSNQYGPGLATDSAGNFVVTWSSYTQDGDRGGVSGQRFDSNGRRVGGEFQVNTYTTDYQWACSVALNDSGNFVVAWQSYGQDGSDYGVFGKRLEFRAAQPMVVDKHSGPGTSSNMNGVLEPGESVQVEPAWMDTVTVPVTATAIASNLTGPAGPTYTINDNSADYGTVTPGSITDCYDATGAHDCYVMTISGARPAAHWDATFVETGSSPLIMKTWTLHVGESFPDVPTTDAFYAFVENLFHNGVTGGCGGGNYCPTNSVTRAQMAVFLLKAKHGSSFVPPACTGIFGDVTCPSAFADWIEELSAEGITGGCGGGNYCPSNPVTRAQMAVFLLKAEHGSTYVPPTCTGIFADVTCPSQFANWIEQLSHENITGGCGGGDYCPDNPNTRGQMAVFLVKTFDLLLYGP